MLGTEIDAEARERLRVLYSGPDADSVLAYHWARTIECPNPGCRFTIPLTTTHTLRVTTAKGSKARNVSLALRVDQKNRRARFEIQETPEARPGTIGARGAVCPSCQSPVNFATLRQAGAAGKLSFQLLAVLCERDGRKVCRVPAADEERLGIEAPCEDPFGTSLPEQALGFRVQAYGLRRHCDLFLPRQLAALTVYSDLVNEAISTQLATDKLGERARIVGLYLGCALGRLASYCNTISHWNLKGGSVAQIFTRQAVPMSWDFIETVPFQDFSGSWQSATGWIVDVLRELPPLSDGHVELGDAAAATYAGKYLFCTDPPYYDNIAYAELSDFFYVWQRRSLAPYWGDLFGTVLVPKDRELIASPFRFGGDRERAKEFFEQQLHETFRRIFEHHDHRFPFCLFYAFKQSEVDETTDPGGAAKTASTGWETMLAGLIGAGWSIGGTLPVRSEKRGRLRAVNSNALASSIVLVCRQRAGDASTTTRGEFRRQLRRELPDALGQLREAEIAPVDFAQAAIGPGMAVFSRHKQVLEADGSAMTVRTALQLINEVLDEYLASSEGDFDADTRFAITWYEQHGWEAGPFGDAETVAKARNVAVSGVVEAGICKAAGGKVRILKRSEMPSDYDPKADDRPTIWEFTQHLIRILESDGEEAAARLFKKLGAQADAARELAYRLYNTCERRKWAEDARSYNGLILAWPELEKLAAKLGDDASAPAPAAKPAKKTVPKKAAPKKKAAKAQGNLFGEDDE